MESLAIVRVTHIMHVNGIQVCHLHLCAYAPVVLYSTKLASLCLCTSSSVQYQATDVCQLKLHKYISLHTVFMYS